MSKLISTLLLSPHDHLAAVEYVLDAVDVDIAVDDIQDFEATAPVNEDQVEDNLAVNKHLPVKSRTKMRKRKNKFGKGAKRGGNQKSSWPVDPTALVNPTTLVARERPTATAAVPVKQILNCTTRRNVFMQRRKQRRQQRS